MKHQPDGIAEKIGMSFRKVASPVAVLLLVAMALLVKPPLLQAADLPAISGVVVEFQSNRPIADAYVIVTYYGFDWISQQPWSLLVRSANYEHCAMVAVTKTDAKGRFHIPESETDGRLYKRRYEVSVIRKGYRYIEKSKYYGNLMRAELLPDNLVEKYDERRGQWRDYSQVHVPDLEQYKTRVLGPHHYISSWLTDRDAMALDSFLPLNRFHPSSNQFAELARYAALWWLDDVPPYIDGTYNDAPDPSACWTVIAYFKKYPSLREEVFARSDRVKSLKNLCVKAKDELDVFMREYGLQ